jgi:hypothetical protein
MLSNLPTNHYGLQARSCVTCGEFKQPEDFHVVPQKKMLCGYQVYKTCKTCEKKRKLDSHLQNTYGITLKDFLGMEKIQGGVCYICGKPPSGKSERLVVDHNHKTGEVRKLLCVTCNVQLAKFEADPNFIQNIIRYLDLPYERK